MFGDTVGPRDVDRGNARSSAAFGGQVDGRTRVVGVVRAQFAILGEFVDGLDDQLLVVIADQQFPPLTSRVGPFCALHPLELTGGAGSGNIVSRRSAVIGLADAQAVFVQNPGRQSKKMKRRRCWSVCGARPPVVRPRSIGACAVEGFKRRQRR